MLNHKIKYRDEVPVSVVIVEILYSLSIGALMLIICSALWKFANNFWNFDHSSYGINLVQYCVIKCSRFVEYYFLHTDTWYDILRLIYCIFVYYCMPIFITSKFCTFYQHAINDCKSGAAKVIGIIIISVCLLSFCVFMFLDVISVLRIVQETDKGFGYIIGTMTN